MKKQTFYASVDRYVYRFSPEEVKNALMKTWGIKQPELHEGYSEIEISCDEEEPDRKFVFVTVRYIKEEELRKTDTY